MGSRPSIERGRHLLKLVYLQHCPDRDVDGHKWRECPRCLAEESLTMPGQERRDVQAFLRSVGADK